MKEIIAKTKLFDLLKYNGKIMGILMKINPKFKKLNKPIVGETLAHEKATLEEMAIK